MSTKIFNGYRIVGAHGTGRADAFAVADAFRQAVEPVRRTAYAQLLATHAALRIDKARIPLPSLPDKPEQDSEAPADTASDTASDSASDTASDTACACGSGSKQSEQTTKRRFPRSRFRIGIPVFDVEADIDEAARKIEETGLRNPEFDLQCELAFMPDPGDPDGLYAIIYTERQDYRDTFAALEGVEKFGYWDCDDDYPPGVTEQDWDAREAIWARVLGTSTPAKHGLTWTLVSKYDGLNPVEVMDEVLAAVPSVAERAKELTYWRVPVAEFDDDDRIVMRDLGVIQAERAALLPELERQLEPITADDLYKTPLPGASDIAG